VNTTTNPTVRPLTSAETEARRCRDQAGAGALRIGADATTAAVRAMLPAAGWAHFACHAMPNHDDPAHSQLLLHDGPLTVAELGRMDLPHAYLAYLSACSTATSVPTLLDEAVSVAAAFQLAGYAHVIATLWPISDALAPNTARHIYTNITTVGPAVAVHDTVRAIRERLPAYPHLWASHIHLGP
jgi:CHAT domain-containing protein